MALRWNKKLLLAKLEGTVGAAENLAAANAVLATGIEVTPVESETVNRELERAFYGGQPDVVVNARTRIAFGIELASSGIADLTDAPNGNGSEDPGFGPFLEACGMSVARDKLVDAVKRTEANYAKGDKVSSTYTDAARGGAKVTRVYEAAQNKANGDAFGTDGLLGGASAEADHVEHWTRVHNPSGSVYAPLTGSEKSLTIEINIDGVQQQLVGCRGTFTLALGTGGIPRLNFTFVGRYADPIAKAQLASSEVRRRFRKAIIPSNAKTPGFELLGAGDWAMSDLSLDWGAEVVQDERIGVAPSAEIVNRNTTGQLTVDARAITDATNLVKRAKEGDSGRFWLQHGPGIDGDVIELWVPDMQLGAPSYQDRQGTFQVQTNFAALPITGGDELVITAR